MNAITIDPRATMTRIIPYEKKRSYIACRSDSRTIVPSLDLSSLMGLKTTSRWRSNRAPEVSHGIAPAADTLSRKYEAKRLWFLSYMNAETILGWDRRVLRTSCASFLDSNASAAVLLSPINCAVVSRSFTMRWRNVMYSYINMPALEMRRLRDAIERITPLILRSIDRRGLAFTSSISVDRTHDLRKPQQFRVRGEIRGLDGFQVDFKPELLTLEIEVDGSPHLEKLLLLSYGQDRFTLDLREDFPVALPFRPGDENQLARFNLIEA